MTPKPLASEHNLLPDPRRSLCDLQIRLCQVAYLRWEWGGEDSKTELRSTVHTRHGIVNRILDPMWDGYLVRLKTTAGTVGARFPTFRHQSMASFHGLSPPFCLFARHVSVYQSRLYSISGCRCLNMTLGGRDQPHAVKTRGAEQTPSYSW